MKRVIKIYGCNRGWLTPKNHQFFDTLKIIFENRHFCKKSNQDLKKIVYHLLLDHSIRTKKIFLYETAQSKVIKSGFMDDRLAVLNAYTVYYSK
jgi:hypothetical protein